MTPLAQAAWMGKDGCVDALLDHDGGAATRDVANNLGATPLIFACQGDHKTVAEKLIAAGGSLDAEDLYVMSGSGAFWLLHVLPSTTVCVSSEGQSLLELVQ